MHKPPRVVVVGDAILDASVRLPSGKEFRRAAEGDAPVVTTFNRDTHYAAGGAANVAVNLAAMGCEVTLVAHAGTDDAGRILSAILADRGVTVLPPTAAPPGTGTTCKIRYYQSDRLVVRVDSDHDLPGFAACPRVPAKDLIASMPEPPGAVVLTDYGRGVVCRPVIADWSSEAASRGVPIFGDPRRDRTREWHNQAGNNGLTGFVLNEDEFKAYAPVDPDWTTESVAYAVAEELLPLVAADLVVVKRAGLGSVLVTSRRMARETSVFAQQAPITLSDGSSAIHVPKIAPARSQGLCDVMGAGDTYLAAFVVAYVKNLSLFDCGFCGSAAAGVAVSQRETTAVTTQQVVESIRRYVVRQKGDTTLPEAVDLASKMRAAGLTVGYTNGCFDVRLHRGHTATLKAAAANCDFLFVGVDSDSQVRRLKGPGRPVIAEHDRVHSVSSVSGVGAAFVFDDLPTTLRQIRPDVVFKGGDYDLDAMPERAIVSEWGGRLFHTGTVDCPSTTSLVTRLSAPAHQP